MPDSGKFRSPLHPEAKPAVRRKASAKTASERGAPASEALARAIAALADDKKAEDIAVLDVRQLSTFTDFLIVAGGNSEPHLKALASGIRQGMRENHGIRAHSEDGGASSQWIVLDYIDVVIHLFAADKRSYYGIEDLWGDAPRLKL